jgi:predicted outer membrane repeat protein
VTVTDSTIAANQGAARGGGLYTSNESTITTSTVSNNTSTLYGGGIYTSGPRATVVNSTVSGNFSETGGGLYADGPTYLVSSTLSDNDATSAGSAVALSYSSSMVVKTTLVNAGSSAVATCSGNLNAIASLGYNLESPSSSCLGGTLPDPTDQFNVSAGALNLGPLQSNGGPTFTHAPVVPSVAIDQIPLADCTDEVGTPITTDQRGNVRPEGSLCDIGSVEVGGGV